MFVLSLRSRQTRYYKQCNYLSGAHTFGFSSVKLNQENRFLCVSDRHTQGVCVPVQYTPSAIQMRGINQVILTLSSWVLLPLRSHHATSKNTLSNTHLKPQHNEAGEFHTHFFFIQLSLMLEKEDKATVVIFWALNCSSAICHINTGYDSFWASLRGFQECLPKTVYNLSHVNPPHAPRHHVGSCNVWL